MGFGRMVAAALAVVLALAAFAPAGCGDNVMDVAPYGEQYYYAWDGPGLVCGARRLRRAAPPAPDRPWGDAERLRALRLPNGDGASRQGVCGGRAFCGGEQRRRGASARSAPPRLIPGVLSERSVRRTRSELRRAPLGEQHSGVSAKR